MSTLRYFFLASNVVETPGFAYGSSTDDGGKEKLTVQRVSNGRWNGLDALTLQLPLSEVESRIIEEDEAIFGIGTYVGSCVCAPRRAKGSAERWHYGVVTGFTWNSGSNIRVLHVTFQDGQEDVGTTKP